VSIYRSLQSGAAMNSQDLVKWMASGCLDYIERLLTDPFTLRALAMIVEYVSQEKTIRRHLVRAKAEAVVWLNGAYTSDEQ
jgi:hypothetical protein